MLILVGQNLGERHRDLNQKVKEAAENKTILNEIHEDTSDIGKLYKIDLASKYKYSDYILEVLKSGDSLYVTRGLKCTWIYDDKFSDIINPTYLHHNIFPHMSQVMKKKMITTISMYVRNYDRVICFYSYCMNSNLKELALKFLIYTPESFKMGLITNDDDFHFFDDAKSLNHFIGRSFELAIAYIEMHCVEDQNNVIHELRFLYSVSAAEYLDILEKYDLLNVKYPDSTRRLGIRISRDILKRYKKRVWKHAVYYTNKLNKNMLVKYFVTEEVKTLGVLLLPSTSKDFWSMDFYNSYQFILDKILANEIFAYLKNVYCSKYEDQLFEMNVDFYNLEYYKMLTTEEQEAWALLHIEREQELLGSGNDYIWYKFVGFDKALKGIKRYVFLTVDNDKRSDIVNILVDAAKSQADVTKLLHYYFERHINENEDYRISFINALIAKHDIYAFTAECWTLLEKIFYSLDVYTTHKTNWDLKNYVMNAMIYYIINEKDFSEELKDFIEYERNFYLFCDIIGSLSEDRRYVVIKYWLNFFADKLRVLLEATVDEKIKDDICYEICNVWHIIWCFRRHDTECPEIVLSYMKSNMDIYNGHPSLRQKFEPMTEGDFVRLLKNDMQKAIDNVSKVKCNAYRWPFRLTRFFRKLKVYFSNDVTEVYLKYFLESLDILKDSPFYVRVYRNIKMAVVGVFRLGNEEVKINLLEKYVPVNKKIDYGNHDNYFLQVQKAICRLAYLSRPAVPLSSILKYITGDYVRFCLPIFNNYLVNLPMPQAIEFIYEIIDSPVSIQKHGLWLAFKCFSTQDLVKVILNVWKKTKNVSLRMVIYVTLFKRLVNEDEDQKELYEVLKSYTLDLDDQDHLDVFDLMVSDDMPEDYRGDYIQTAWQTVCKFSDKKLNLVRKTNVVNHIRENINLVERAFLLDYIIDDHVRTVLIENRLTNTYSSQQLSNLMDAKWNIIAAFIVNDNSTNEILVQSQKLLQKILMKCLQTWNNEDKDVVDTKRQFCNNFLNTLHNESCLSHVRYMNAVPIYRCILQQFQKSLSIKELYLPTWKLKLSIKSRRVIYKHYKAHNKCLNYRYPCVFEVADAFAKKIGKVVKQLVDRRGFYYSFYSEMGTVLADVCETMARIMKISPNGFKILVSGLLTQFKMIETHTLAIMIIPRVPPENWENRHKNAVEMLNQYNNEEIQSNIVNKFESSKCKLRKII